MAGPSPGKMPLCCHEHPVFTSRRGPLRHQCRSANHWSPGHSGRPGPALPHGGHMGQRQPLETPWRTPGGPPPVAPGGCGQPQDPDDGPGAPPGAAAGFQQPSRPGQCPGRPDLLPHGPPAVCGGGGSAAPDPQLVSGLRVVALLLSGGCSPEQRAGTGAGHGTAPGRRRRLEALPLHIPPVASSQIRQRPDPALAPKELLPILASQRLYGFTAHDVPAHAARQ